MMRSLWSAVSGLNTHQMEMDVIGNNISNVNTTSYKSQSTGFKDIMYQTIKNGSGGTANLARTNVTQVGLGARLGSVFTNISAQGSAISTGYALDLMITGDSFFVVSPDITSGERNFTRDGGFSIDEQGYLVTRNNGYYVLGALGENPVESDQERMQIIKRERFDWDESGKVDANEENLDYVLGEPTTEAYFKGNIDKNDKNLKEGINVTLSVFGKDGKEYNLRFKFTDAEDEDDSTYKAILDRVTDEDGNEVKLSKTSELLLTYNKHDGNLESISVNGGAASKNTNVRLIFEGDASKIGPINVDFSHSSNYASLMSGHNSTINAYAGDTQGQNKGYARGLLTSISITNDGSIYGLYSNGQAIKKGQIAVAEFTNAVGLEKVGDNLYAASLNSGAAMYKDVTEDGGYMSSGVLEGSNVDLSKEFTDMITTQRGFQANSKVITTSDEMLQILKGLKR